MIKDGLVSVTFRKLSVDEVIKACENAQVGCIEWGGDVHVPHGDVALAERVAKMCLNVGIEIVSYGSYYRAAYSEKHENLNFKAVLDTALALGAGTVRTWAGWLIDSAEADDNNQRKEIVDDLLRIGAMATEQNVDIGIEFHNGTLTDCNESALRLRGELGEESNIKYYWQPKLDYSYESCVAGIRMLFPKISNIHVSHYGVGDDGKFIQLPVSEGFDRWLCFLGEIVRDGKDHVAMLEFVEGNSVESFYREIATLKELIKQIEEFCHAKALR